MKNLEKIGLTEELKSHFNEYRKKGLSLGRVALEHKKSFRVWLEKGDYLCTLAGKFTFGASVREDLPAVGDWVAVKTFPGEPLGTIQAILPRKSKFSRKTAGLVIEEQIVASNVDTVFLISSLNDDLNLRRIERYLLLAWESGANPVVVLSKSDLVPSTVDTKISEVSSVALGVPVIAVSVYDQTGMEELSKYLIPGKTIALIGSSGVGKSSLVNYLAGYEKQQVKDIRENDHKGKHTTTHRELIQLEGEALLIDTPGMREIQLWTGEEGVSESFPDIEEYACACKFRDCRHVNEPGCAVRKAISEGILDEKRLNNYNKLLKELAFINRKIDSKSQADMKRTWKNINKEMRRKAKFKGK